MANEAFLDIRPRIVGDVRLELLRTGAAINRFTSQQVSGLRRVESVGERAVSVYRRMGTVVGGVGRTLSTVTRSVFSLRTAIVGLALGGAGRSFIDATIGSNDRIQRAQLQLRAILGDQDRINAATDRARGLTSEIANIDFSQAIQGIGATIGLANGDVERAGELVRLAKALESLSPEQGFDGALFALRELESGDTMSLRSRFNIRLPTRAEGEALARESGQTLQAVYFDRLEENLDTRFGGGVEGQGVEALLGISNQTLSGQLAFLRTQVNDLFTDIGAGAFEVANRRLPELGAALAELRADPRFIRLTERFGEGFADFADRAIDFVRDLPDHVDVASARLQAFVDRNAALLSFIRSTAEFTIDAASTLARVSGDVLGERGRDSAIGALGTYMALNSVTEGGAGRGLGAAASGLLSVGRRFLPGRAGQAAGLAEQAAATPVRVVNWHEAGSLGGGFRGRNALGAGAGGAGSVGAAGFGAAGAALLPGLVVGGAFLGGVLTLAHATRLTNGIVDSYREDRLQRERDEARVPTFEDRGQRAFQSDTALGPMLPGLQAQQDQQAAFLATLQGTVIPGILATQQGLRFDRAGNAIFERGGINEGSVAQARGQVEALFGGAGELFTASDNQVALLEQINASLSGTGLRFDLSEGQSIGEGRFAGGAAALTEEQLAQAQRINTILDSLIDAEGRAISPEAEQVLGELQASGEFNRLLQESDALNALIADATARAELLNQSAGQFRDVSIGSFQIVLENPVVDAAGLDEVAAGNLRDQTARLVAEALESSQRGSE